MRYFKYYSSAECYPEFLLNSQIGMLSPEADLQFVKNRNKIHHPYEPFLKKHEIPSRETPFDFKWFKLIESNKSNSSRSIVQSKVLAPKNRSMIQLQRVNDASYQILKVSSCKS